VAYAGCISRTLTPSLRLGWIALPPSLIHEVTAQKLYADMGNSTLEQLALSRFIGYGGIGGTAIRDGITLLGSILA
jgi:GntR family transcriptional regulator/MocR family aminotransferase